MQRQSLGSPSSKVQIHGGDRVPDKEEKRKSGFSPESELAASASPIDARMEKHKRPNSKSDSSIHLVPILILLCFTVLYLCSHEPSAEDLVVSGSFANILNHRGITGAEKAGGLPLRRHRALKEAGLARLRRMGPNS